MNERAALIRRVRAALGDDRRAPATPPAPLARLFRADGDDDAAALFERRASELGVEVSRTAPTAAAGHVVALARALGLRRVTLALAPGPLADAARAGLAAAGAEMIDHRAHPGTSAHFDSDAGITDAAAAVAETGTVVMSSDAHHPRGAHLAPPIHIVLLDERAIVRDLLDLWPAQLEQADMPSAITLVSGPSKTADIEGILIRGVHGPGRVLVVIVER